MKNPTKSPVEAKVYAALLRASLYQFLALGFGYPAEDYRERLRGRWQTLTASAEGWPEDVRKRLEETMVALDEKDNPPLASEYLRLFGPAAVCPLFETSYGAASQLLGKAVRLADVSGFYLAFGVQPSTGETFPEDHLTLELEFLGVLALKEAYALSNGDEEPLAITRDAACKFLEEHLGVWTGAWLDLLRKNTPPTFYAKLGETLCALILAESRRLGAAPIPVSARLADQEADGNNFTCPQVT